MTEYEYEYYSVTQKWPNTNTNIIRLPRNDQIRILFGFPKMTEYKYHLASQKWSNSINEYKFCWGSQKEGLQYQFWVSQGDAKFAESSDDWSQLQMQKAQVLKEENSLIFSDDWLIQSSEKWKCGDKFSCAHLSRIGAHSSKVSMLSKICIVFRKKIPSGIQF